MVNHFKTALNDPKFIEKYKDKPIHKAILNAFAAYRDKGKSIYDLPWFKFANHNKKGVEHGGKQSFQDY